MPQPDRPQDVWKTQASGVRPARGGPRSRGRRRWLAAGLVVAALGGVIAGLLVYLRPHSPPVVLALPVADYDHPDWPPDPLAAADAAAFLKRAGGEGTQAFEAQYKEPIVRELKAAAKQARGRPVVVFLTALGVAEGGKVHIIPGDGRPDDPGTWLALDDILSPLRHAAGPCLLVLDVRPATDPRSVLTGEDVNAALGDALAALERTGGLPFFVLTANNPPAGANELRAFRRTAFGLALAQGAGGEADGWNPTRKRNGRVSVRELAAYVRELTPYAAAAAGLPPQVPQLHGPTTDFDAFQVPQGGPPELPALADPDPDRYPKFLREAWQERDAWVADGLHRRAPRVVRHFALAATRAERRWLAGGELAGIVGAFDPPASRLRAVRPTLGPVVPPVGSVARAGRRSGANPASARPVLQPVFDCILQPPGPARDKAPAAMAAAWGKPLEGDSLDAAAVAIVTFARNVQRPTAQQMTLLAALVAGIKPHPPRHAELATIALIGSLPPEDTDKWPQQAVRVLLNVAALAEEAAAIDGTALPWVKADLARADAARRAAVKTLCDPESREKGRMEAVAALEAAGNDYKDVRADADALARARHELEEARAVLSDLADVFPFDSPGVDQIAAQQWADLTEDYFRVRQLLAPPGVGRVDRDKLVRAAQNLQAGREQLQRLVRIPGAGGVRQLETLLRWPGWSETERTQLLAKLADADLLAARKVRDGWLREPPAREAVPPPRGASLVPPVVRLLERKVAVLKLAGAKTAGDLGAELAALGADPPPKPVAVLASKVRVACRRELKAAYEAADLAAQAEVGWAVDPDDVSAFPSDTNPSPNPEPAVRHSAEAEFHHWLGRTRYAEDARLLGDSPSKAAQDAAGWYGEIGQAYTRAFR